MVIEWKDEDEAKAKAKADNSHIQLLSECCRAQNG
jgi:hypothetical protein